jgi:hypothetical protein
VPLPAFLPYPRPARKNIALVAKALIDKKGWQNPYLIIKTGGCYSIRTITKSAAEAGGTNASVGQPAYPPGPTDAWLP